jgi:hypothetical protein
MAKYSEKLTEKIVKLIEEDRYTISDICSILNISRKTFYSWRDTKPEFCKAIDNATQIREEKLQVKARLSLQKKLDGYTLTETKYKYIPDENDPTQLKLKEKVVKVKEYAPDNRAIKLVLDRAIPNKAPELQTEATNRSLQITVLDDDTRQQLKTLHERLQKKAG